MSSSHGPAETCQGRQRARWLSRLALSSDSPRRTAAAFALGVFLSFSPFFGLQVAIGLGTALLLRLNRIAVMIGLCTNLPWVMVPWYALTTALGAVVLGVPVAADVSQRIRQLLDLPIYRTVFWQRAADLVWPFLGSFVLGSTAGALLVGAIAYVLTHRAVSRMRATRPTAWRDSEVDHQH
jgi:uncharacterized protein